MIKRRTGSLVLPALTAVSAATVFIYLLNLVVSGETLSWDESLLLWISQFRGRGLTLLFLGITNSVTYFAVIPIGLMTLYLWRRGERRQAILPLLSIVVFPVTAHFIKSMVNRERPSVVTHLVIEHSSSFPSGHTMTAMGIFGLIALLLWRRDKKVPALLSCLWVLLVAISRLYLGVHYPSDVMASLMIGVILLLLVFLVDRRIMGQCTEIQV